MVSPGLNNEQPGRKAWGIPALVILWGAVGVGALLLLAKSVQNSTAFDRLQPWILLLNITGVVALTVLLARKLWQLVRDYRDHVPGSRLTARTVSIFGALVVAPLPSGSPRGWPSPGARSRFRNSSAHVERLRSDGCPARPVTCRLHQIATCSDRIPRNWNSLVQLLRRTTWHMPCSSSDENRV